MTSDSNETFNQGTGPRALNWGVLGSARIGRKVLPAMRAAGGRPIAVGSRTLDRAREFAGEMQIDYPIEGYQAVIDHPEVEAVYIPLPNSEHFHWALACARAGKPCLSEKPLVLSADEARQLREAFRQAGVRLVEGFMWRHNPQTAWLLQQLQNGEIGDLVSIHGEFCFNLDRPNNYRWQDQHGGGSLWDVGCYCVNAMRLFFGEEPEQVSCRVDLAPGMSKTDMSAVGWLDFGQGRLGTFHSSFGSHFHQRLLLTGTRGLIEVYRPFIGVIDEPTRCRVENANGELIEEFPPSNSFTEMIIHFRRAIRDSSYALTPAEDGVGQAAVMEALAASAASYGAPRSPADC